MCSDKTDLKRSKYRERSGSVVECLTRDRGAAGSSLTDVTAVVLLEQDTVLVQPRKTRPCLTERLLMGRKESNQTNKEANTVLYGNHKLRLTISSLLYQSKTKNSSVHKGKIA